MAGKKRKSRAKYSTRFRNAIKKIRSALAILKRKKIVPKTTLVKNALPTPSLRKLVRKNKAVIEGAATTYKLPTDIPAQVLKDLRSMGYRTTGKGSDRRLVVPKTQYVRKGEIYERPTRSRKGYKIERKRIEMDRTEQQVKAAFDTLRPGDLAGFEVGAPGGQGGRSYNLYADPESMLRELMAYQERGFKFTHLAVFRVTQAKQPDYIDDVSRRSRERVVGSPQYREAKLRARRSAYNSLTREQRREIYLQERDRQRKTRRSRGH